MPRKDDIQGLLADRFKNFEAEPQVDLWKGIEAELYPEKKSSRKLWPYFSIAASITILIFTWVYLGKTEVNQDLKPAFVEETLPSKESIKQSPVISVPSDEVEQETQMAQETEKPSHQPIKKVDFQVKEELKTPVAESKSPSQPLPKPLFQKQELMEKKMAVNDLESGKVDKKDPQVEVAPIAKELLASHHVKIEQPEAKHIPQSQSIDPPATGEKIEESNKIDLNNISFKNIVSLASDGIDKIKEASPVKVYEEKNDRGESKVYQLNLFKLSVSHKTQKRRNKKVRL